MKRMLALLVFLMLSVSCALADMPDFTGMSQDEILDAINAGRNALVLEQAEDSLLRYDTGHGIVILFNGFIDRTSSKYNFISVTIVNDSDTDYQIYIDSLYINGWNVDTVCACHVKAHRRMNAEWGFALAEANLTSVDEITEMEYDLRIYPEEGRSRDKLSIPTATIIIQ